MLSHDISSEIAVAILAEKKTPQELKQLKDVILQVHTTLQEMSQQARAKRLQTWGVETLKRSNERGY
jgi:hypothetical protein